MDASEIDQLESALDRTEAILAGVRADQAELPTPCNEYDVAGLVDHLVGWATSFAAKVTGGTFEGDPNDFRAGADPVGEFHAAAQTIAAAYRAGRPEAEKLPVGMLLMEYVGHGWDLATATGQPVTFTAAEAEPALGWVSRCSSRSTEARARPSGSRPKPARRPAPSSGWWPSWAARLAGRRVRHPVPQLPSAVRSTGAGERAAVRLPRPCRRGA